MIYADLSKMVDHEIQWLSYYSTDDSRSNLTIDSNIYSDLIQMGYCKRPTPLHLRCSICLLSNDSEISESTDLKSLVKVDRVKTKFDYTPLEAFLILYPDQKKIIIDKLRPKESKWEPFYLELWKH